jgi:hypothetical protein
MEVDLISRMIPKTLDGIIMWIIAFAMLSLLFRRYDKASKSREKFWTKENYVENFVLLFVFCLTIIIFIKHLFFSEGEESIVEIDHILIPATVNSIILSLIAFATLLFTLLFYLTRKERRYPPVRNFVFSILIVLLFLGLKKAGTVLLAPYGTFVISMVNLTTDIFIFGLLVSYIFSSTILYTINAIRE